MFKLKGKMLWIFTLILIGLMGLSVYFYQSLGSINKNVENALAPDKNSSHLKQIMLDLNKFNSLYLVRKNMASTQMSDSLIQRITIRIDSIQLNQPNGQERDTEQLDTIPYLLKQIRNDYAALEKNRERQQEELYSDFKVFLEDELHTQKTRSSDSVKIVERINSEVYERSLESNDTLKDSEDKRNFFQRLFGADKPKKTNSKRVTIRDTLIDRKIDTLTSRSADSLAFDIEPSLQKFQNQRSQLLRQLNQRERNIFQSNMEIYNDVEKILNNIIFTEYQNQQNSIIKLQENAQSKLYIIAIIVGLLILGVIISLFIIFKDINRNIFYQKKLQENEAKARHEAEEEQKFLSTMSHELRTPLTSIIGYIDLLNHDDENVKALKSASSYLYEMTNEILDIAKIKAGIIDVNKKPVNFTKGLDTIVQSFSKPIKTKGLDFEHKIPEEDIYVETDLQLLQHILYNLLHNALKFTEKGEISFHVFAHVDNPDYFILEIKDTGVGMTDLEIDSIFKDYQQAGTHKNKLKGTGLGLGVVKKLVQKLEGKMYIKSTINKGTYFRLEFRLKRLTGYKEKQSPLLKPNKNLLHNIHICIVEDDELISKLLTKVLITYGAKITSFSDPQEAFDQLIDYEGIDLFIFDYKMPEMTGYALLQKLKERDPDLPPAIISTANTMLSDAEKSHISAFDDKIFKPMKTEKIIATVCGLLAIENTAQEEESETIAEEKPSYSLTTLSAYAGDDPAALQELVQSLVDENEIDLSKLQKGIAQKDVESCRDAIHRLISRFGQVEVKEKIDLEKLRQALHDDQAEFQQEKLTALHAYWQNINRQIQKDLKSLN
ncbi:MAG: ATP-binding protein [Psychroflexus sp.]|nr:ATP-binding protein [Psychroflexus sp.]